ncbi:dynein heavy chain 5, axonemal [Trichonephila clavipes]|nr:dynein heavy chain 5, axonemal [Trichonephila clavipes]
MGRLEKRAFNIGMPHKACSAIRGNWIARGSCPVNKWLKAETWKWCEAFGGACRMKYKAEMQRCSQEVKGFMQRLNQPFSTTEEIKALISVLEEIREKEVDIDSAITPVEECFITLAIYKLVPNKEDLDTIENLRYLWEQTQKQSTETQNSLLDMKTQFQAQLRSGTVFLETESAGRRPGQGSRPATTPNEDRYLELKARRHRNMNATLLQQHLRSATGTTVSTQTVRNRLHGVGLYARRPLVCVRLTSRHRRDRRERIFIWRDRGSRNNPAFVHESVRFVGGGVLVYGGISIDGRTYLYII